MYKLSQLEPTIDMTRKGILILDYEMLLTMDTKIREGLFSKLFIVRAEFLAISNEMEYYAFCPEFRPIKQDEMCPKYTVNINIDDEGNETIWFS